METIADFRKNRRVPQNISLLSVVRTSIAIVILAASAACAGDLPDSRITPGAINPDVTQDNIQQTVCVKGYTKTIRPPAYFTNKLKKAQLEQSDYSNRNPRLFEEDHLIALSVGGAARDELNLWPQPRTGHWNAAKKDQLEFVMLKMLCRNEISLADAQHAMATDWIAAWKHYVPAHKHMGFSRVD